MAYATAADFVQLYGDRESLQLSNRNQPTATIDNARIDVALEAASGIIDSWIGGRYVVPIAIPAQLEPLRIHCLRLARCELDNVNTREKVSHDCDLTYDWLEKVATGKIELGGPLLPGQVAVDGGVTGPRQRSRRCKSERIDLRGYTDTGSYR